MSLPSSRPLPEPPARRSNRERTYIVAYDISDQRRWRRVYKLMRGYGHWLQLSLFQCRLSGARRAEMAMRLEEMIARDADHVLILDLGPADDIGIAVESIGKAFTPIERRAIVL
jgi:CRISPR-associated protein Cas2